MKVSVIVSVRNPGAAADAGIRSVLEQSLPPDEYEVIFVDDGSAEPFAARLDALAASRPNVRVLHLEPTGSPMRGRNMGIAAAKGEYVYLLDQGDRLEPDALARMYARAVATEADVLLGRLVREESGPQTAFGINRDRADILRDRLLTQLTPHKLFRRRFLADHDLRFPEPGGALAECAFVLRAYLSAKVIAILADRVCCHVAARARPSDDPETIAEEVRALLDVVDEHTVPGKLRDRVYAHWLRVAVLRPFTTRRFLTSSQNRGVLFTTLRELVLERFPPHLDSHLPVHLRAVAALLRAGRLDELCLLAGTSRGVRMRAELHGARWDDGVLTLTLGAEIVDADGSPMRFARSRDGRLFWRPPVNAPILPPDLADVSDAVARARLSVHVRHAETGVTYALPATGGVTLLRDSDPDARREDGVDDTVRVRLEGEARLDPCTAALGHPLPRGLWEIHVRAHGGAYRASARLGAAEDAIDCVGTVTEYPRRLVMPCWTRNGELAVCVEPRSYAESIALVSQGVSITRRRGHLFVVVPVPYVPPSGGPAVELVLRSRSREVAVPALAEPGIPGRMTGQLIAKVPVRRLPAEDCLRPGRWSPSLRVDGREVDLRFTLEMSLLNRVRLRSATLPAAPAPSGSSRARRVWRRAALR
ncbi:glycosyltransferase family 2 protein [Thermostaphylospora chromogena]|uniref:glycosyltransferase family 2 protein n=1 Tax=Thermostaphylospora chromogena TaxID=35622 RepID=UPI0013F648D1|nr:glycosyltransferase family 2 protein [Thermostaphylospora chromogena]